MAKKKDKKPEHSPLGASSMKRWQACPGSVNLCRGKSSKSSAYAAEGTVAHDIAEQNLRGKGKLESFIGKVVSNNGHKITITKEMVDAVKVYVDHLRNDIMKLDAGFKTFIEQKFHLSTIHEDLYGTSDFTCYLPSTKTLYVRDYKHGAGVAVDVEDNPQLLYYALGALLDSGVPAAKVDVGIVQPRCEHPDGYIRSKVFESVDLLEWSGVLEEAAIATEDPKAPLNEGDHCRWCPAAVECPEKLKAVQAAAAVDFEEVAVMDAPELAEMLTLVEKLEPWCKAVREKAYAEAEHGREPQGWKLVQKRATRKWRKDSDAVKELLKYGMDEDDIYADRKLKTPPQIEKIIGKDDKEVLVDLVVKESSGLKLVRESESGEPVRLDPKSDFA